LGDRQCMIPSSQCQDCGGSTVSFAIRGE
jgi:hypothetical protein